MASGQIAHHLLCSGVSLDWSQEPEEFRDLVLPRTDASRSALLLCLSLSDENPYFLSVIDGRVMALHTLVEPHELRPAGGKFVAFGRDFRIVSGQHVPDPNYISNCNQELDDAGVPPADQLPWVD